MIPPPRWPDPPPQPLSFPRQPIPIATQTSLWRTTLRGDSFDAPPPAYRHEHPLVAVPVYSHNFSLKSSAKPGGKGMYSTDGHSTSPCAKELAARLRREERTKQKRFYPRRFKIGNLFKPLFIIVLVFVSVGIPLILTRYIDHRHKEVWKMKAPEHDMQPGQKALLPPPSSHGHESGAADALQHINAFWHGRKCSGAPSIAIPSFSVLCFILSATLFVMQLVTGNAGPTSGQQGHRAAQTA